MSVGVITATVVIFVSLVIIRKFREKQWRKCRSKILMTNKVIIVTGANSGIGKATVEELAKRDARVIMACRDIAKAKEAVNDIRKRTKSGVLKILVLDLASFASIRKFADSFLSTEERLDVLINNAGVFQCPFALTENGYEMQFGVNHLGHFYLTKLLLDRLKQSAPSRIVNVSSSLYKKGKLSFIEQNSEIHYDKQRAYSNSKLANVLFTQELAKRLENTGVTVYVVSPGIVWTNLGRHVKLPWWKIALLAPVGLLFVRTPYQGCQTVLHCSLSKDVENETGLYYSNCARSKLSNLECDDAMAKALWEYSEKCISND